MLGGELGGRCWGEKHCVGGVAVDDVQGRMVLNRCGRCG